MPFDPTVTSRHFANHCGDLPCEVQLLGGFKTAPIAGSKGSNVIGKQFLEAGGTLTYDLSVWIPKSDKMKEPPALKSRIRVDGKELKVGNLEEYPDGVGWRLDLGHPEDFSL